MSLRSALPSARCFIGIALLLTVGLIAAPGEVRGQAADSARPEPLVLGKEVVVMERGGKPTVVGRLPMASSSGSVAKEGAIVTAIGGVPVQTMADLRARYDSVATGDTVAVTFERDGTEQTLRLEKTEMNIEVRTQGSGGEGLRRR